MAPRARTLVEMRFAASLEPCTACGSTEPPTLELIGQGEWWTLAGPCPTCKRARSFTWRTEGDPTRGAHAVRHLGDSRPSAIIRPGQFVAKLDRVLPMIVLDPQRLAPTDWYASRDALNRALTCLIELAKFVPAGAADIPDDALNTDERADRAARPERYAREWLVEEQQRLLDVLAGYQEDAARIDAIELPASPAPAGALDAPALFEHERWLRSDRWGPGRLEVVGYDAAGARLVAHDLTAARLVDVTLDGGVLDGATLVNAELIGVRANDAHLASVRFDDARLSRVSLLRGTLPHVHFDRAFIDASDLRETVLDRTTWPDAYVGTTAFDGSTFGDAVLDAATFSRCTFARADFRSRSAATTRAVFEDCDLRSTRWHGRDVAGATFVRCKLAGVQGRPGGLDAATFVETDLSPDGDGSDIAGPADVRAVWR
jgi:uncharacterized protein YjbI with pentapeptide repeats